MNGPKTDPVWVHLKGACANCAGDVDWNFRWGVGWGLEVLAACVSAFKQLRSQTPGFNVCALSKFWLQSIQSVPPRPFPSPSPRGKFLVDKEGNVVTRSGDNPLALEAKIKELLAA